VTRQKSKPKVFESGQAVQVQREVGKPWEQATYERKLTDMRGWHRVRLSEAQGRYIDSMSGMVVASDHYRSFLSCVLIVPTQRIRAQESR
jgi:hypothetical protein